jgi:predicted nucleotidyltransferase
VREHFGRSKGAGFRLAEATVGAPGVAEPHRAYGADGPEAPGEIRRKTLQAELDRIVPIIIDKYRPEKIILFGSLAEGRVHETSDLDLAIIKETDRRFLDRMLDVDLLARPWVGVDFFVYTPKEFESKVAEGESFFTDEILGKGRVLYERQREMAGLRAG